MGKAREWQSRSCAASLRSSLLVSTWVANFRYGSKRRIAGFDDPTVRMADFARISRLLQERHSVIRAQLLNSVGEVSVLRVELEHDIEVGLRALAQIIEHEDQPFARAQMRQMLDSLAGLERFVVRPRRRAA